MAFIHVLKGWEHRSWLDILAQVFRLQISAISKVVMVFGSAYLLWLFRKKLSSIVLTYGFCSLALLLSSGALSSINRYAYGIVSLSIALGLLLAAKPTWGYGLIGLFAVFLLYVSVRFAGFFVGSLEPIALNLFYLPSCLKKSLFRTAWRSDRLLQLPAQLVRSDRPNFPVVLLKSQTQGYYRWKSSR